jgi:hypothetical protein
MTLPEYLAEFINIKPQDDQVEIYFNNFTWDGQTPVSNEVLLYQMPLTQWKKDKEKKTISHRLLPRSSRSNCRDGGDLRRSGWHCGRAAGLRLCLPKALQQPFTASH